MSLLDTRFTDVSRFSDDATLGRKVLQTNTTTTYQDSHFCSRDVPGASRSELDADCRRFLALYTRHTFAFATRGPSGPGPQVMYPHVIPLCSTTTMTVLPSERPPLPFGTPYSPSSTSLRIHTHIRTRTHNTRVAKNKLSFFNERISFSSFFVKYLRSRYLIFFFFFFTCLRRYLDCALVLYFL